MRDPRRLLADVRPSSIDPRDVAAGLGAVALALAGLAVVAPPSLLAPIAGAFGGAGAVVTVGFAILAVLAAGLAVWGPVLADTDSRADRRAADGTDLGTDPGSTGELVDDVLEHVESDAIPWQTGASVARAAEDLWEELRELAVEAVAERDGCSHTTASKRVATGEWTDDPYAASFLRDISKPVLPAHVRIADWLRGRHLTHRIRRTVDAIATARNAATAPDATPAGDARPGRDESSETPTAATDGAGVAPVGGTAPAPADGTDSAPAAGPTVDPPTGDPGDAHGSRGVRRETHLELRPAERSPGYGADAGLVAGVGAAVVGTLLGNAAVLLSAVVGCAYAAYGYAMPDPETDVSVARWVETASPAAGTSVGVSLTVTNEGEAAIPDLRIRDSVPEGLEVTAGETALATSLEPGKTADLSYEVEATTGTHHFGETELVAENVAGTARFDESVTLDTRIVCDHTTDAVPLSDQTTPYRGRVPADVGGSGTEFYATREYQPGDPTNRIDWNRYASTREPTTIEFREHRAAEVLVVLDADSPAADVRRSTTADPATLGRSAGSEIVTELLAANNEVGAARVDRFDTTAFGRRASVDYVRPLADDLQSTRIERLFAVRMDDLGSVLRGEQSGDPDATGRTVRFKRDALDRLVGTIRAETQVIVLTPLLDDGQVDTIVRLLAAGHDVTVAMPDVLPDTPGGRIDGLDRAARIARVRRRGAIVLPWSPEESLSIALARSRRREVMAG
jgi:uncharacterized protein (DUF58 family)